MSSNMNKRNLSVQILVGCALLIASGNTLAMSCEDLFNHGSSTGHTLEGPKVPIPSGQEPPAWNLMARRNLSQLDKAISNVQGASSETLHSEVEAAAARLKTLGTFGNDRLDPLIKAIISNPHAVEYRGTSFARNVIFHLVHDSANADHVVARFFEAALNATDDAHAPLYSSVVFQYGNGKGAISRYPLYHRAIELLESSPHLTQRQGKNLMDLLSAMSGRHFEDRISNEHSNEASAYWGMFFEQGLPESVIHLSDNERASLAATLSQTPGLTSLQYEIALSLLGGAGPTTSGTLESRGKVIAANILETQSAAVADLWLAQNIVHH